MARLESIALGGYYPTPRHLIPLIAQLVGVPKSATRNEEVTFLDPCAGDGEALFDLMDALESTETNAHFRPYAIELERKRHQDLLTRFGSYRKDDALRGDAFCARWVKRTGVSLLYLNPPYDLDKVHRRLEERFLTRFTSVLADGGTLMFVVPYYALKASATTLATHFDQLECFRFPKDDFETFKQVVLIGKKAPASESEGEFAGAQPHLKALVETWAKSPESMPELIPGMGPKWSLPVADYTYQGAFQRWVMTPVDLDLVLESVRPWQTADKHGRDMPIHGILPEPGGDLLKREYPLAMPPRPAHIAAGIASGIFNGARVAPNDPKSGLPELLVKGAFDKEFQTVEEKQNKGGEITGVVQVQQPKLRVTVLDLSTYRYHTLATDAVPSESANIAEMSTGDLLQHYGRSLLQTLLEHCPVMHDPVNPEHLLPLPIRIKGHDKPLDPTAKHIIPRDLFTAQAHVTMAAVRLLGGLHASRAERRGKAAFVLGEIGSGKSTVALATAHSIGSKRILILCPPHLLKSWEDQIAAVCPWAKVAILKTVSDVEAFVSPEGPAQKDDLDFPWEDDPEEPLRIAILSRETAKLGHALKAVQKACPDCGAELPKVDLVKRRARCEAQTLTPKDALARYAVEIAHIVKRRYPEDVRAHTLLRGALLRKLLKQWLQKPIGPEGDRHIRSNTRLRQITRALVDQITVQDTELIPPVLELLAGINDQTMIAEAALKIQQRSQEDTSTYGPGSLLRTTARTLALMLPPDSPIQHKVVEQLKATTEVTVGGYRPNVWTEFEGKLNKLRRTTEYGWFSEYQNIEVDAEGTLHYDGKPLGDTQHILAALSVIANQGSWRKSKPCGAALFQSSPEPRRVPLATYIAKRYPRFFDLLIVDEGHEYATDGSAQERAAHRLTALGLPTLLLTGSVMNGYAESLFTNLWALSPAFRREFNRDERSAFVNRYGYKKRFVQHTDSEGKVVEFGSVTDRVTEKARDTGQAPGVLPLLLLRHLLPMSATLHKADLALDIPKCHEIPVVIQPSAAQGNRHSTMLRVLLDQIKKDRFVEDLSGKLFGQLAEAPSQLDRATDDVGNCPDGAYEVRYPESIGGDLVYRVEPFPASTILPKEEWMLDTIETELAEGRNVMVFSWHVNLLPRLTRLIEDRIGEKVAVLNPAKVPTGKREAWIEKEVIGKNRRVMLTNPVAVKTGLNPLVHFATEIFMENPACDPITYRQTVGRVDRIGQTKESRIYFPMYDTLSQTGLHKLLLLKVAVSMATDGLDAESALAASGVGEQADYAGLSVGKALYDLLHEREVA